MFSNATNATAIVATMVLCVALLAGVVPAAQAARLADPTRPAGYALGRGRHHVHRPRWDLSQTLIAPDRRLAIINGRTVTEGARVDGAVVVAIRPSAVKLRRKGRTFSIKLLAGSVKRPVH